MRTADRQSVVSKLVRRLKSVFLYRKELNHRFIFDFGMILPKVRVYPEMPVDKASTDTFDSLDVFRDKLVGVRVIFRDGFKGFKVSINCSLDHEGKV